MYIVSVHVSRHDTNADVIQIFISTAVDYYRFIDSLNSNFDVLNVR